MQVDPKKEDGSSLNRVTAILDSLQGFIHSISLMFMAHHLLPQINSWVAVVIVLIYVIKR